MRASTGLLLLALCACGAAAAPVPEVAVVTLTRPEPVAPEPTPLPPTTAHPAAPAAADAPPVMWTDQGGAPKGTLRLGRASAVPALPDMAAVLVSLRPRLLRCVDHAARRDPGLAMPMVLEVRLGAGGEVISAMVLPPGGVPVELSTCIVSQLLGARFAPPPGGSAKLTLPLDVSAK